MDTQFLALVVLVAAINSGYTETQFSARDLDYVTAMHEAYCIQSKRCTAPEAMVLPTPSILDIGSVLLPTLPFVPTLYPEPPQRNDGSCCKDCSCDIEWCTITGTCCPDMLKFLPTVNESFSTIKQECANTSLKPGVAGTVPSSEPVWMYSKCSDGYTIRSTKEKCENPEQYSELDTKVPVYDNNTTTTYKNIHCATCNNVSKENIVYWDAVIECLGSEFLPSSIDTVVAEIAQDPGCNLLYKSNRPDTFQTCTYTISECNVTKQWELYDPVIEAACHAYTAVFDSRYNNLFCYLCNEPNFTAPGICQSVIEPTVMTSFSALLNFDSQQPSVQIPDDVSSGSCEETQIYDPQKVIWFKHIYFKSVYTIQYNFQS